MKDFIFEKCLLDNIRQITPKMNKGEKDIFVKSYERGLYADHGIDFIPTEEYRITEDRFIFRGIHLQYHKPQKRIISVLTGEAYITVVNLDKKSSQLGQHETFLLKESEPKLIYAPEWFGVATISLKNNTTISVMSDGLYYEKYSGGIRYDDATLKIQWLVQDFCISEKDRNLMTFDEYMCL